MPKWRAGLGSTMKITTLPQLLVPKKHEYNIINIPIGLSVLSFKIDRLNWPDTGNDIISGLVEISFDAGVTWPIRNGFTTIGGIILDEKGAELPYTSIQFKIPDISNKDRQLRYSLDIRTTLSLKYTLEIT